MKKNHTHLFNLITKVFPAYHAELCDKSDETALAYKPQYESAQNHLNFPLKDGYSLVLYIPQEDLRITEQIKKMVSSLIEISLDKDCLLNHLYVSKDNLSFLTTRLFNPAGTESLAHVAFSGLSMGYDLTISRRVFVLELQSLEADGILRASILRSILYAIRSYSKRSSQDLAVQLSSSRIALCKHFDGNSSGQHRQAIDYFSMLCAYLINYFHISIQIGAGNSTKNISDYSTSLVQAQSALKYARIFSHGQLIHFYEDYIFEEEFSRIPPEILKHFFEGYCTQLDAAPLLAETVEALVIHNMDINSTAKALFMHRNTIVFRMNQIKKALRLNPLHNDSDRFTMISLYIYYKLYHQKSIKN